jgi:hypothetical protein
MAKGFVAVTVLAMVVLRLSQVSAQSWPAPAPYMRGWEPSSAPGYAPEYAPGYAPEYAPVYAPEYAPSYAPAWAPEYAPAGAPLGSPLSAPPPYVFTPSPSITVYEPNLAPGPMSA